MSSKRYAFFDFDGTLTKTDTVLPFLRFCCGNTVWFYLKLLRLLPILLGYLRGKIPNDIAKEAVITAYLRGRSEEQIIELSKKFVENQLPHLLRPEGMAHLRECQKNGDLCVLVTASPDWYPQIWAQQNGFTACLATQMQVVSGCLTGKIDGENCHDEAKVRKINQAFGDTCWQDSVAYSDARVDLPMLSRASRGYLWDKKTQQFVLIDYISSSSSSGL